MSAKCITFDILNRAPLGSVFSGMQLQKEVISAGGGMHYPDTILRYMREWRNSQKETTIKLVDKKKSIYQKIGRQ